VAGVQDADGDSVPDFAASSASPVDSLTLYSGATGSILHTWLAEPGDGIFPAAIEPAGDVDADGRGDLIAYDGGTEYAFGTARVFSGSSGATLLRVPDIVPYESNSVGAAGDVDADGHDDVVVLVGYPGAGTVLSGADGSTLFTYGNAIVNNEGSGVALLGDATGDGIADFLFARTSPYAEILATVTVFSGADGASLFMVNQFTDIEAWAGYGAPNWGPPVRGVGDVDLDGVPDFSATGWTDNGSVSVFSGALSSFVIDIAGDIWLTHYDLLPKGTLEPDSPLQLRMADFPPAAPVLLVVGLSALKAPCNFTTLVPSPDLLVGPFIADVSGTAVLDSIWPAAIPPGTEIWFQAWSPPVVGPEWAASNGLDADS
jgi:hypothetical protein